MTTDPTGRVSHWRQNDAGATERIGGSSTPVDPIEGEVTGEDRAIAAQIKTRVRARLDAAARKETT